MNTSLKLLSVAAVSAVLTGGAVFTYFRSGLGQESAPAGTAPEWLTETTGGGLVPVAIGWDSPETGWRIKDAIRIEVRSGEFTLDGRTMPIDTLEAHIDAAVKAGGVRYVVLNAPIEGSFGDVIAAVDRCRRTKLKAIVINGEVLYRAYGRN